MKNILIINDEFKLVNPYIYDSYVVEVEKFYMKPLKDIEETFKNHAKKQNAKVWFAGVGIANAESVENPVFKDQPYYVAFEDFIKILE